MILSSLLVAAGGFLGATARYAVSRILQSKGEFPRSTLIVNGTGSFLLGMLIGLPGSDSWVLFAGTGFMGSFTTFSTLNWETVQLQKEKSLLKALRYLGISYIVGLALAIAGYGLVTLL